jgi:hypothetical protein
MQRQVRLGFRSRPRARSETLIDRRLLYHASNRNARTGRGDDRLQRPRQAAGQDGRMVIAVQARRSRLARSSLSNPRPDLHVQGWQRQLPLQMQAQCTHCSTVFIGIARNRHRSAVTARLFRIATGWGCLHR